MKIWRSSTTCIAFGSMSLIATIRVWLFGSSSTPTHATSLATDQPCRYRLDNDTSATLTLPDGRKLGYAQYGSPTGKAILYQHGFPGSRLEAAQHHDLGKELGLRVIAIDRPGIGWSSPHPESTLLDWPRDVERLTEHLGLETYSVMVFATPHISNIEHLELISERGFRAAVLRHLYVRTRSHLRNSKPFLSSAPWVRLI